MTLLQHWPHEGAARATVGGRAVGTAHEELHDVRIQRGDVCAAAEGFFLGS